MGIFTINTTKLGNSDYTVVANENYSGVAGAMQVLIDGAQNDQALFEALIATDFQEIEYARLNESAKIASLNEATGEGVFSRLKEFIKKMWEKLKGIITSFVNKLKAKFISNNAKLVSKYGTDVRKKTFGKNFVYKYSETELIKPSKDLDVIKDIINPKNDKYFAMTDYTKVEKEISNGTTAKMLYSSLVSNGTTNDNFADKFHKKMFKSEKEYRGLDSSRLSSIMKNLENGKEEIEKVKELQDSLDDFCKDLISTYDDLADKYAEGDSDDVILKNNIEKDLYNTKAAKSSKGQLTKMAVIYSKLASLGQTVCSKYTSAYLKEIKFGIAQDRKVFIKAIGWRDSQNESAEDTSILFNAIDESVDYDLEELI